MNVLKIYRLIGLSVLCSTSVQAFTSLPLVSNVLSEGKLKSDKDNKENKKQEYTVSGYITESGSGENLFGVSVYVPELRIGVTTNTYGFYSLTLPEGKHNLVISYMGYATINKEITIINDKSLSFALETSVESLKEVVVSAKESIKESKVTQMSKVQIDPADIKDIPALLGEKDVLKSLQLLPGIQGGSEGSSGFFVRGGTPDQNLIILDDAVVYNSNHLFGFFSVFNGDAIKSIEAFKGGFPARFGGRLSSVIKIDMKDGNKEKLSGKINVGLISSSLLLEGPINKGKTSFIFSGRRTYADILTQPFLNKNSKGGYYFGDLNFKIHHVFGDKDKLYWSNYAGRDKFYSRDKQEGYDYGNGYVDSGYEDKANLNWGNITSTLRWNHQFNGKFFSNTSFIFSNYKFSVGLDERYDNQKYIFKSSSGINDYSLKSDYYYYPNNKHTVRFGLLGTMHKFTPQRVQIKEAEVPEVNTSQELKSFESAFYLEDDYKITERLNFSGGLRISGFNYKAKNYFNIEPRIAMSYKFKSDMALKASYSKMNQYIHLLSSSGIGLPTDLWVSSTDQVKPQESQQLALGIAKDFLNNNYSFTLEGYYKKMDNVIAYKEGASFLALDNLESGKSIDWQENITSGKGWAYGGEILFRKKKGPLTGWLGYTLSWSERQFEELNLGRKFYDRYDRRHDISLVGIYKPNPKITLSATWVLSTGNNYTLPNLQKLPPVDNFPIRGEETSFYGASASFDPESFTTQRNNFRAETSHRLDLGIQFIKKKKKNRERIWGFSLYNSYARKNPFIYTVSRDWGEWNDPDAVIENKLERTSVLLLIPSFNYTFKF